MKQIFTLLTIALLTGSSFKANSQYINESFESSAEVTNLQSMCWTFNNFNYTSSTPLVGTGGSVISTIGNAAEIYTPFLQMPSSLAISFSYNTVTSTGGSKTLKILLKVSIYNLTHPATFRSLIQTQIHQAPTSMAIKK
jgi:hypothetical protein